MSGETLWWRKPKHTNGFRIGKEKDSIGIFGRTNNEKAAIKPVEK